MLCYKYHGLDTKHFTYYLAGTNSLRNLSQFARAASYETIVAFLSFSSPCSSPRSLDGPS